MSVQRSMVCSGLDAVRKREAALWLVSSWISSRRWEEWSEAKAVWWEAARPHITQKRGYMPHFSSLNNACVFVCTRMWLRSELVFALIHQLQSSFIWCWWPVKLLTFNRKHLSVLGRLLDTRRLSRPAPGYHSCSSLMALFSQGQTKSDHKASIHDVQIFTGQDFVS